MSPSNPTRDTASCDRICQYMNEEHPLSLYAMVQSTLETAAGRDDPRGDKFLKTTSTIKNCRMTSIDLDEIKISYITCSENDATCSRPKEANIPFHPPLKQSLDDKQGEEEALSRLVQMHHKCLAPRFSWLITDSTCQTILLSMAGLAYAHYFVDIPQALKQDAILGSMIGGVAEKWGHRIENAIKVSWMFGVLAHLAEAVYVAYTCKVCLNMTYRNVVSWFLVVTLVGYPMTSKVLRLKNVQQMMSEKSSNIMKKKKKK